MQKRVAELLGVTQKTVSLWLTTNIPKYNSGKPDARLVIPKEQHPA